MELLNTKWLRSITIMRMFVFALLTLLLQVNGAMAQHDHGMRKNKEARPELGTSFTFDAKGRLWAIMAVGESGKRHAVISHSDDQGKSWSSGTQINSKPEAISADGENTPKVVSGTNGALYATWIKITSERYTGDVRFSRSLDGGKTWSAPINVHTNSALITHRFESVITDAAGRIFVVWVDKRDLHEAEKAGKPYPGAALYYTMSDDGGASFKPERKLADHSCECCRIGLSLDRDGVPVAFWRHVYVDADAKDEQIRDHATARLTWDEKPPVVQRATFSGWKLNGCPHHGGDLAVTADGVRHQAWFAMPDGKPSLFYSRLDPKGERVDKERPVATGQVSRPMVISEGDKLWLTWKVLTEKDTQLMARWSADGGNTWSDPRTVAASTGANDHPRLVTYNGKTFVGWRSQPEGVRVFALGSTMKEKTP